MNHSLSAYVAAALALLAVPGCFRRAAESDFCWLVRTQHGGVLPPATELERRRANCQADSARYQRHLQRKTFYSFVWVAAFAVAAALLVVLPVAGTAARLNSQQLYSASSVLAFAWGTLGRLGWAEGSNKGATVFEELDTYIFWMLYGVGTFCGVAAVASAAA